MVGLVSESLPFVCTVTPHESVWSHVRSRDSIWPFDHIEIGRPLIWTTSLGSVIAIRAIDPKLNCKGGSQLLEVYAAASRLGFS